MMLFYRMAQFGSGCLLLKGAAFLVVAALGWTSLPSPLLGGMALTWMAGGMLLARQARRAGRRLARGESERSGVAAGGETGRLVPLPRQG